MALASHTRRRQPESWCPGWPHREGPGPQVSRVTLQMPHFKPRVTNSNAVGSGK